MRWKVSVSALRARSVLAIAIVLLMALPALDTAAPAPAAPYSAMPPGRGSGQSDPPAVWQDLDSMSATLEIPPGEMRVLRANMTSGALEPVDWPDPLAGVSATGREAVARVEPWLRGGLAAGLRRLGYSADAFAREVRDCSDARFRDEVAFAVAHTPPEVLAGVPPALLTTNARLLYSQDASLPYADLVERQGDDGNYTTVSYVNATGARWELPRDVYYFYVAHPRVFWEGPAAVSGKSLWRKAYFDELTYGSSGTLASALGACGDYVAAIQNATVWLHRQLEFGYGTNYVQPVEIILDRFGSCGEYSIAAAAALKVAMVPARVTIYTASDHQWNEVWLDGGWTFIDASSDVAGAATVREPELIPLIGSINFNDPDNFERSGWKPFMSMTNSFRPDDVDINSIGIRTYGPAYTCSGGNWSSPRVAVPHKYTDTSRVHITVVDAQGDPVEAAWVGVLELAHDPYNVNSFPYALFACANYTNATGQCEVEVGKQGTCARGHAHSYTVEILSPYGEKEAVYPGDMPVTEEGVDLYYTYTVYGDAPALASPRWTVSPLPELPPQVLIDLDIAASGAQRHSHGEYGGNEMFAFGTTFDHEFPATVDCALMDADALAALLAGGAPEVVWGEYDVDHADVTVPHYAEWSDLYLVILNTDSYASTKVVELGTSLRAKMFPRLDLRAPVGGVDLSTAAPLAVRGTVRDHCPVAALCATVDSSTWYDIMGALDDGEFNTTLDVSGLPSGEYTVAVRATDAAGVWREENATVYLDADDPVLRVNSPLDGEHLAAEGKVRIEGTAIDNRFIALINVRFVGRSWSLDLPLDDGRFAIDVEPLGEVGPLPLEVEAWDACGRSAAVRIQVVLDPMPPIIQLRKPDSSKPVVVGPVASVELTGSVWDDYGLGALLYREGGGDWVDATEYMSGDGAFTLTVPTAGWADGHRVLELKALDRAGHEDSLNVTYDVDMTPPALDLEPLLESYEDSAAVSLRGRVTDAHGVELVSVAVDGGDPAAVDVGADGTIEASLPWGPTMVGAHTVRVFAVDALGSSTYVDLAYEVVDATPPEVTVEEPYDGARLTWGHAFVVQGTATDNVGVVRVEVALKNWNWTPVEGAARTRVDWSLEVDFPEWSHALFGLVDIEVRAYDGSGLFGLVLLSVELADTTPPVLVIGPPFEGTAYEVLTDQNLRLNITATDDDRVEGYWHRIDGGPWIPDAHAIHTVGVPVGTHQIEVRITDPAGNEAVRSTTFIVRERPEEGGPSMVAMAGLALLGALIVVAVMVILKWRRRPAEAPPPYGGEHGGTGDAQQGGTGAAAPAEAPPPTPPSPGPPS